MDLESILRQGDCTGSAGVMWWISAGCSGYSVKLQEGVDVSPECWAFLAPAPRCEKSKMG